MKRVLILGYGAMASIAANALIGVGMEVEEVASLTETPYKNRNIRGPSLREPQSPGAFGRSRAQWRDETNRRGRNR